MWEEEIAIIMNDDKLHDIDYQVKDGRVCTYHIRGIRRSDRYGKNFIEVYSSCTNFQNSYWDWRTFKLSSIKAIDGNTYEESIGYRRQQEQKFTERRKEEQLSQSVQSSENPHEAGCAIAGGLGMLCMILGAAFFGSPGGVIGFIVGNVVGYMIGNNIDKQ